MWRGLGEVLVVAHPHLEDAAGHADLGAQGVHHAVVELLHAPAHAVRGLQHALLLLRRELDPEPLLARRRGRGGRPTHGRLHLARRGRPGGRGAAQLLARELGQRGG
uniref:Uncharacterized protein n=1 Tax=Triticum urartu TaxID=4572 RepID=A0A8R7PEU2_TRIUA